MDKVSFEKIQKEIQDLIKLRMEFYKSMIENIEKLQKRIQKYRNENDR